MIQVNIHEAKTQLSKLLNLVSGGEEVLIARYGEPIARLVRCSPPAKKRQGGKDRGLFQVPPDFDDEMDDVIQLFES